MDPGIPLLIIYVYVIGRGVGVYLASFVVPNLELSYFQQGHSVLRCTLRFYFTLILQSNLGTLEAHSGVGVYLASFVVPNLERLHFQKDNPF